MHRLGDPVSDMEAYKKSRNLALALLVAFAVGFLTIKLSFYNANAAEELQEIQVTAKAR